MHWQSALEMSSEYIKWDLVFNLFILVNVTVATVSPFRYLEQSNLL